MPVPTGVEHLAQGRYMNLDCILFDDAARPDPLHEPIFADDIASRRRQFPQDVQRPSAQLDRLSAATQLAISRIKPERSKNYVVLSHLRGASLFRTLQLLNQGP
jgi:hypothetical protein